MSPQPYPQAVASARTVLANVQAEDMSNETPCAAWNVNELVNHLVGTQHFFLAGLQGTAPSDEEIDYAAGDFLAAYDEVSAVAVEAFAVEGVMQRTFKLPFGEMPGVALAGLAATDTFQHGWDLAKATGQSTDLDSALAGSLLEASKMMIQDGFRGPEGAPFGAEQECADDACNADQLAAFLGRTV